MQAFHTFEKSLFGLPIRIELFGDDSSDFPWADHDGHGIIRTERKNYGHPDKRPGEVIVHDDSGTYWLYDVQATTKKAKAEGWGGSDSGALTRGQRAAAAVAEDMDYCRRFLTGDLFYIGAVFSVLADDGRPTGTTDSIWGLEFGYRGKDYEAAISYIEELAADFAENEHDARLSVWRAALKEARARRYWAQRDIPTIAA